MPFVLNSPTINGRGPMPERYTGDDVDVSPPLAWTDPPPATRSLALIVEDPDAPDGTFRHWGVYNIDPQVRELPEGAGDARRETRFATTVNDFGEPGYNGPKPPRGHGTHHYHFRLVALDVDRLELPPTATAGDLWSAVQGHMVGQTELVATYSR